MPVSIVTGAAGFIGSHVCDHLLTLGHTVIALDDLSGGKRDNVPDGCEFVAESVTNYGRINTLFNHRKPDFVFHFAAYAAEGLSHYIRRFNYETNLIGSVNLINAAVNAGTVKRFVFASSAAVYGAMRSVATETVPPEPIDPYAIAKLAVEHDLYAARTMFGLPFTIFRCHNIYGERQNLNDLHRNAVAIFMRQCLQGKPMTIFGNGMQTRQFSYIGDIAPHLVRCIEMENTEDQVFNIGASDPTSIINLAEQVARALDMTSPRIEFLPSRAEVQHVWVHHGKFEMYFDAHCEVSLAEGLSRMAAWARTQTLAEPRQFENIEIEQGLPAHWRVKP